MSRFHRLLIVISFVFGTALTGSAAFACSCLSIDVAPDVFLRKVDLVFGGDLLSTRPGDTEGCRQGCTIGTFRVGTPLKGKLGETVEIRYYTSEGTSCEWGFPVNERSTIVAYGDLKKGYYAGICSQYIVEHGQHHEEIWSLALKNRERTAALASFGERDVPAQLKLLHWLSEYRSNEEGLAAADNLLTHEPRNREALLFKEGYLSDLNRDTEALEISDSLLARNGTDAIAAKRRILALVRLGRMSEVPDDWRDFDGLKVKGTDFSNRTLAGASFRDARLTEVKFTNTDLSKADFSGATFNGADFKGAKLVGANFKGANGGLDLSGADISSADFTSANLGWVQLVGAKAHGAVLVGSCMDGDIMGVDLTGADLRGAQLLGESNILDQWAGAILRDADLRGAQLGALFLDIDISGARYNDFTLWRAPADPQKRGAIRVDDADPNTPPPWHPCPRP